MNRKIVFAPGEYYHLYNRGVEKRDIFMDDSDRHRFISLLYLCNSGASITIRDLLKDGYTEESLFDVPIDDHYVAIGAYCLMDNHIHLLVKEIDDNGISHFMQKLMTAYTMYFNQKYKRVGPLFQGVFKAEHADDDQYLQYLCAYIHLNPLKMFDPHWRTTKGLSERLIKNIFSYTYSSFLDYSKNEETRVQSKILNKKEFPQYFENKHDFMKYHMEWLSFNRGLTSVEKD